eukprot:scaffold21.g2105.t1
MARAKFVRASPSSSDRHMTSPGSLLWRTGERALVIMDAQHGEREGDPKPRCAEGLAEEWAPYLTLDTPQSVYAALNKLWASEPVLLRGTPLVAGLAGRWSFQHLVRIMGGQHELPVLCSGARRNRFLEYDDGKNGRASPYHVREPETQRLAMSFPDFAQCAARWQARRVFCKVTAMRYRPEAQPPQQQQPGQQRQQLAGAAAQLQPDPAACGPRLQSELQGGVDWAWLEGLQRSQRFGPVLGVELEAGTADGLLPARYQRHDLLLAQVAGRRRVLLFSPDQAFEGLYPYPVHHTYDGYSMVDLEAPDTGLWPKAARLRGRAAILQPGDVLFVPQFWFAHVQHLEAESLGLTFRLAQGSRPPAAAAAPLRLSRVVEERVAALEGLSDVRHWCQVIGHGEEHEWIDLGTVKGYKRVVACQGIRDDVEAGMGPGAWATLLPRMCEGRLVPTPWLNKDFREPLYLLDRPVWVEDTRSEEERRYPELFRTKLEAEGWSVPKTTSTVPIPGAQAGAALSCAAQCPTSHSCRGCPAQVGDQSKIDSEWQQQISKQND